MKNLKMRLVGVLMACAVGLAPSFGAAQGQLTPVITVNERAITQYELSQRARLLDVFNTPGDLNRLAREGLIEDRLKQQEIDRFNRQLSTAELEQELAAFAQRANLTLPEFISVLRANGVDNQSFAEYVSTGVLWRNYIRARFNREVTVTEGDIDRAIAARGINSTQLEVLLSEIIIPAPPERAARVREVANQISQLRSFDEFSDAALQVSALPSRENGGRLDWRPINSYPPQLRQQLLELRPGEVTEPIDIPNAVALFQKRGQREAPQAALTPLSIEYATFTLPGGRTEAAQQRARAVADRVDTCDDLYGVARDEPDGTLDRVTLAPDAISDDLALELARLDQNEFSYNLTSNNGESLVFLMLCARNSAGAGTTDRALVANQIRSQRLGALSEALVADLRASAVIRP